MLVGFVDYFVDFVEVILDYYDKIEIYVGWISVVSDILEFENVFGEVIIEICFI